MSTHATWTMDNKIWDEKPYDEGEGLPKLTRASITSAYHGDLEGEGKLEYLMIYRDDGIATYVGLERITGALGGRTGSFVLQHSGTYENGVATTTFSIVPATGTGELQGLRGAGGYTARNEEQGGQPTPLTLDYELA